MIAEKQAERLEQLAAARGDSESALVEQAIELLFRSTQSEMDRADWEFLRQLEAENPSLPHRRTFALDPADFQVTHAVPVAPETLRR